MKEEKTIWNKTSESLLQDNMTEVNNRAPLISTRKSRRKLKSLNQEDSTKEDEGIDYPLDIWFIISEYIPPETVGKFAGICRSSYYVTTTAKFWFHLYKMYHQYILYSPVCLQPQYVMRQHGLRAYVIRALHCYYFPSVLHRYINNIADLTQEKPYSLVRRECTLIWHEGGPIRWNYFFKLKEISKIHNNSLKENKKRNKKTKFNKRLENVAVNPEEGSKVLKVSCLKYSTFAPIMGLVLQTQSVSLMPDRRNLRLLLEFGTSIVPSTLTNKVILSDVINYCIFDWWDSCYPGHASKCNDDVFHD